MFINVFYPIKDCTHYLCKSFQFCQGQNFVIWLRNGDSDLVEDGIWKITGMRENVAKQHFFLFP